MSVDETKTNEIQKSLELILKADNAGRSDWVQNYVNNLAYYNGIQIDESTANALEAEQLPVLPINEVRPAIELLVSMLTENSPRFNSMPVERSDVKDAAYANIFMSWLWSKSRGNARIARGVLDAEISGLMILMPYVDWEADYGRGEVRFTVINPEHFYIDPNATEDDLSDANWFMIVKKVEESVAEYMFPDVNLKEIAGETADIEFTPEAKAMENEILKVVEGESKYYLLMDRYQKVRVNRYCISDPITGYEKILDKKGFNEYLDKPAIVLTQMGRNSGYIYTEYEVNKFLEVLQDYGDIIHYEEDPVTGAQIIVAGVEVGNPTEYPGSTTQIQATTMSQLFQQGILTYEVKKVERVRRVYSLGRTVLEDEVTLWSELPVAIGMIGGNRNPYPISDMTLVKALQDQLNITNLIIIKYNRAISNISAFVPEGTNMKKLAESMGQIGMSFAEYDADTGVPVIVQLTQMANAFYEYRNTLIAQIQRILGSYALQDGDSSQAPRTKGGTMLVDQYGQRRIKAKVKIIDETINKLGKLIAEMIPYVYKERKVIRVIKPNKEPQEIVLNDPIKEGEGLKFVNDISTFKFDIQFVSGSMLATNLMAQFDILERMFQMGAMQDPTAMLQLLPLENVEEILAREDRLKQAAQQISQLEQEVKKLSGDLQTSNRAEVQSRKKVEVEKFKTDLKATQSDLGAQVKIAKNKLVEQSKDGNQKNKPADQSRGNSQKKR